MYTGYPASGTAGAAVQAGQFLHLALDAYDPTGFWPESRAFSIASPPSDEASCGSRTRSTADSRRGWKRELSEGAEVWVKMPYGDFVVTGEDVVLFAGGTGITAVYRVSRECRGGARQVDRARVRREDERAPRVPAADRSVRERRAGARCFVLR